MKPLDPRLLRHAAAARLFLAIGAAIGLAQTLCTIGFAWLVADVVVRCIAGDDPASIVPALGALAAVVLVRAALVWLSETNAVRGAVAVKEQLRGRVLAAVTTLGPGWLARRSTGSLLTLLGGGLDALDGYFARYLPQLLLTAISMPVLVLVVLLADPLSAVFVIVTIPLIPVFMVLIGWATQAVQRKQWQRLQSLASGFLDTVGGLSTLKIYGRAERQGDRIRAVTEDYRVHTMKVLRVTFVSGFVLEFGASLAVALVAVSIGIRLVDGTMGLFIGLFVLILIPDVFLPLRQVGVQFHAAADGVAAADDVFAILEEAADASGHSSAASAAVVTDAPLSAAGPPAPAGTLELADLAVSYAGVPALAAVTSRFAPGTVTAITGPSGAGKSSLVAALLGFAPHEGTIRYGGRTVAGRELLPAIAWAGQRPGLIAGTVADNVTLGAPAADAAAPAAAAASADAALVARALDLAGAGDEAALRPDRVVGPGGTGISGGQAQRVGVARAVYRVLSGRASILVLDEPSSALDAVSEARLVAGVRVLVAERGSDLIVLVVSHRDAVIGAADAVLAIEAPASVAVVPSAAAASTSEVSA